MLANRKPKEKDTIDLMLNQIDFHRMTAKELARNQFAILFDGLVPLF